MLTPDEQKAVEACGRIYCDDEWCDGKCTLCIEPHVLLGDALTAIDHARSKRRAERSVRLSALFQD